MSIENHPTGTPEGPSRLEEVRLRFESWRQHRKKRTRIPKSLWEAAVALSEEYSISHLSKVLRVNHTALKNRIQQKNHEDGSASYVSATPFLELPIPSLNTVSDCTVEMFRNDGAALKMHLKGLSGSDLLELGKTFWSNGS